MSVINKICTFILVCLLLAGGAVLILDAVGLTDILTAGYAYIENSSTLFLVLCGCVLIALAILIVLVKILIRPAKTAKIPAADGHNSVLITLATLEDMVKNTALAIPGVVGVTAKVRAKHSGLYVQTKIRVTYEDRVTSITSKLQDDVKLVIEASTTLPVKSVAVFVTKAAGETSADAVRQRVEATNAEQAATTESFQFEDVEDFRRE